MADLILRDAVAGDAAALVPIRAAIVRDPFITFTTVEPTGDDIADEIADADARGHPYLVAVQDGRVVGFATYRQFRAGPGYARTMEHTLHIAAQARGRGIGSALMLALLSRAAADGVEALVAGISGENPAGIAFHRRMSFAEVGRLPGVGFKHGRRLDLVLMQIEPARATG